MMENLVIKSEKLLEMIEKIIKDYKVFAPVEEN